MSWTPQQIAFLEANRDRIEARRTFQFDFRSVTVRAIEGSTPWPDGTHIWMPALNVIQAEGIQALTVAVKSGRSRPTIVAHDGGVTLDAPMYAYIGMGGKGNDRMQGGSTSRLYGGAGDDHLTAKGANSILDGGPGTDTLIGSGGIPMFGGPGDDHIIVDDRVIGHRIEGGSGNDLIEGGGGPDMIFGGPGDDTIYGGNGNDVIYTGPGNNVIDGGNGDDTIHTQGNARLTGGSGTDTFIIGPSGTVQITDWWNNEVIDLTSWAANPRFLQVAPNSVLIFDGARGVEVNSPTAITVAQVRERVLL